MYNRDRIQNQKFYIETSYDATSKGTYGIYSKNIKFPTVCIQKYFFGECLITPFFLASLFASSVAIATSRCIHDIYKHAQYC